VTVDRHWLKRSIGSARSHQDLLRPDGLADGRHDSGCIVRSSVPHPGRPTALPQFSPSRHPSCNVCRAETGDFRRDCLTLDQAKSLYQSEYWDRIDGDRLPASIALLVFDAAINNGIGHAVRWLQQAALVAQDGVIGPATLTAINTMVAKPDGTAELCAELLAQRLVFMTSLPTWKSFGLGWARRLFRLPYGPVQLHLER
jgi:hypothetical protein